ncbi:armadillo repeat-containing protein 10 isoform 2-T2 [Rhynchocyon petersi]
MGGARDVGWVAAGLVLGAGACYCLYRLTRGRREARQPRLRPSRSAEDLTDGSYDEGLNAEQLQKLLYLLESTEDPALTERALVTLGNNAAFSANQVYVNQVCEDVVFSGPLNSAVQMAGLRLLTNMTVTNDHQHMLNSYITDFFHMLLAGNGSTKVQVLKLLLNLSENPAMTEQLFSAQVDSSFLSLYDTQVAKEILLRVLTLFQNLNNCIKMDGHSALKSPFSFPKGSLFSLLYGQECAQKMQALVHHPDVDVKEKVVIIT